MTNVSVTGQEICGFNWIFNFNMPSILLHQSTFNITQKWWFIM